MSATNQRHSVFTGVKVTPADRLLIERAAAERRTTHSAVIREAIRTHLGDDKRDGTDR